jgi:hypothetical protein
MQDAFHHSEGAILKINVNNYAPAIMPSAEEPDSV